MTYYDQGFYDQIRDGALRSAHIIVPQLINIFGPINSVVDLGCGTGAWLSVFKEYGAELTWGHDGSRDEHMLIPDEDFIQMDLANDELWLSHKVDLAMSLEVAEHLPESAADRFVASLTNSSDRILFSAAIPGQGGVNHINEQWPSYWVPKFKAHGYKWSSNFRFDFWHDERIENWYRQNILLFVKDVELEADYNRKYFLNQPKVLDVVHYNNWMGKI
jgi:SAM-dependent methyltransferase